MKVSLVVAASDNHMIGKDNQLLWKIRDDLKLFKQTTDGHVVIHGRKSFESVGKPLPNRTNIIITRNADYTHAGAFVVHSLKEAIALGANVSSSPKICTQVSFCTNFRQRFHCWTKEVPPKLVSKR